MVRRQLLKFGAVGVANTLLSLALFAALTAAGAPAAPAAAAAFAAGAVNSYVLNRGWTFRRRSSGAFRRHVVVQGGGVAATAAGMQLLAGPLAALHLVAFATTTAAVTAATFVASRSWTFAPRDAARAEAPSPRRRSRFGSSSRYRWR